MSRILSSSSAHYLSFFFWFACEPIAHSSSLWKKTCAHPTDPHATYVFLANLSSLREIQVATPNFKAKIKPPRLFLPFLCAKKFSADVLTLISHSLIQRGDFPSFSPSRNNPFLPLLFPSRDFIGSRPLRLSSFFFLKVGSLPRKKSGSHRNIVHCTHKR